MKKELNLCNYYGMCDENGKSVGHTVKVTNEYAKMLFPYFHISLFASPSIVKEADCDFFSEIKSVRYDIHIDGNSIGKRIYDKFKIIKNIAQILKEDGIFFFYQVDFFFFFYTYFFYRKNARKKIYCLIYHQDFTGGKLEKLLDTIYKMALQKIDGVIYTQKNQKINHSKTFWMPDYLFDETIYGKYLQLDKVDRCVCLGTMNRYKQLEELIEVFTTISMPLLIVGRFDDKERYKQLVRCKSENVEIRDENISYEEYLRLLGSSRFSVIPYDMSQYQNRTSGVLLESIYVGSIPIAPEMLLKQNLLPGIGYQNMEKLLTEEIINVLDNGKLQEIRKHYDKQKFVEKLRNWLD